jgi:ribonuclease HI
VIDSINNKWVHGWVKTNFKNKKNPDLWLRWLKIEKQFNVEYRWVKGHAGHPMNERCDELAVQAALSTDLLIDYEFESIQNSENQLFD